MPTDAKMQVIHVFPTQDSFIQNQTSVEENDLAFVPLEIASQAEAEAGTNNTKMMTPLRVKQMMDKSVSVISRTESQTTYSGKPAYRRVTVFSDGFVEEEWRIYVPYGTNHLITLAYPCKDTNYFIGTTDALGGQTAGRTYIQSTTEARIVTYYSGSNRDTCWVTSLMRYWTDTSNIAGLL